MIEVTVFYDYNCPFCYLGSMCLNKLSGEFDMDIIWKGIEIHPELPHEGKRRSKTLKSKRVAVSVIEMAREDGFQIRLPGFAANSRLSLEGSELARAKGRFTDFHQGVYEAYFMRGQNIGDIGVLLGIGEYAGLDKDELEEALKSRSMFDKIENNKNESDKSHILGVPTFIFGKFPVHGYQSMDTFRKIILKSLERS